MMNNSLSPVLLYSTTINRITKSGKLIFAYEGQNNAAE